MGRNRGGDEIGEKEKHAGLLRLAQALTFLVVFAAGVVIGLTTTSHINTHNNFISQPHHYASSSSSSSHNCTTIITQTHVDTFLNPTNLTHTLSDDQLFWTASLVPTKQDYPYRRIPKVAFMFLTRGPLPMLPLWERFFQGHAHLFNIYVHAPPGYSLNVSTSSPFHTRHIPSQVSFVSSINIYIHYVIRFYNVHA